MNSIQNTRGIVAEIGLAGCNQVPDRFDEVPSPIRPDLEPASRTRTHLETYPVILEPVIRLLPHRVAGRAPSEIRIVNDYL